jgi:hypothetical protein
MIFKSGVFTEASGSYQGLTWSHNKGGMYVRARAIPTDPNSAFQQTVRVSLAQLAVRWADVLTQEQRDAWATYAENVPLLNALGDARQIPPLSMYIRCNVPRLQVGLTAVDDGPVFFNLGEYTEPVITVTGTNASVAFTVADLWASEVGSAMLVYASQQKAPTINFFKGPYRYLGRINGAGTPPTSPASLALGYTPAVDNKLFFRVNVTRADGRLATPFRSSAIVA